MEPSLLDELIGQIATLSSIYHKPPEAFIMKTINLTSGKITLNLLPFSSFMVNRFAGIEEEEELDEEPLGEDDETATTASTSTASYSNRPSATSAKAATGGDLLDLYDSTPSIPTKPGIPATGSVNLLDDIGVANPASKVAAPVAKVPIVTAEVWGMISLLKLSDNLSLIQVGHGITINGAIVKSNGKITFEMDIGNVTSTPVVQLAIQFNKNTYGITTANPSINFPAPIVNGRYDNMKHLFLFYS